MLFPVTYDGVHAFFRNRPYADVYCHGVNGVVAPAKQLHLSLLVDTGADYLELPNSVARQLNINLNAGYPQNQILTAGGYLPVTVVNNFTVTIEGKNVSVTAHFSSISNGLLGLRAILAAVNFGLDTKQWLYEL